VGAGSEADACIRALTGDKEKLQWKPTVINSKSELLDHCQVPAHSVQAINIETCRGVRRGGGTKTVSLHYICTSPEITS